MTPEIALLLLRFLRFGAAMLLWGGGLYLLFIAPAGLAARLRARLRLLPVLAVAVLVAVTALRLPLLAASFGAGWVDALNGGVVSAVLGTWTGRAWLVDASLALLLVAGLFAGRFAWPATTALAGVLLATSALTGHAAAGEGNWVPLHQLNDVLHLAAAGFWLGALLPLSLTLRHEGAALEAVHAVRRFAIAGQWAVAVIVGTGALNAILVTGGSPLRWSSTYDVLLLLKIAIVLAMLGLACINHFTLLPRLAAGSNGAAEAMRRRVGLELALGVTAVGLVAIFGTLDPS